MKKILMFESTKLCYASSESFLHSIGDALVNSGYEVEYGLYDDEDKDSLEMYIGRDYVAAIDVNSVLTNAVWNDSDYFINALNVPFFNLIVDHPMHLHDRLSVPLKNYNIICVDSDHCEYITRHYPHIKNVIYMPFAGTKAAEYIPFKNRKYDILFPGTYVPPYEYRERIIRQNPELLTVAMKTHELLKQNNKLTFEEALWRAATGYMESIGGRLELLGNVERFIRTLFRSEAIEMLLESGSKITVEGENWNMFEKNGRKNLEILPACSYREMLSHIADSKIVFNIQPLFLNGPHDRVFNAVINGAVPFTDSCSYIEENFVNDKDIITFSRSNMNSIPQIIQSVFNDINSLEYIADNTKNKALELHTWEKRVHIITDRLEKLI